MQRITKAASRFLVLAPSLVLLSAIALATSSARAQAASEPPAAAFPGLDLPAAPSAAPAAPSAAPPTPSAVPPASSAGPPGDVLSSPPVATPLAPALPPTLVPPAAQQPPPTGSAAFAPLPNEVRTPTVEPSNPSLGTPRRAPNASATPPLATLEPSRAANTYESEPESQSEKKNDSDGVFGPIRVGFLIGTGLPDLLSLGGTIKLTKYIGLGVNIGLIPTVKLSFYGDATLSYQEYDAYLRVYPFGGAFFLGSGLGYGTVKGTLSNRYTLTPEQSAASGLASPVEVDSAGSVRTMLLTPQLGFLKTFSSGFSIGVDAGAQIAIAPSKVDYQTRVPAGVPREQVTPTDDKVRSTLDTIGRTTLPTVNFKIGWLL